MREHGSAAAVLAALPGLAARAGVRDYSVASVEETRAEQQAARRFEAADGEAGRARAVADYIAGMTDRYAILEHRRLFDPSERT